MAKIRIRWAPNSLQIAALVLQLYSMSGKGAVLVQVPADAGVSPQLVRYVALNAAPESVSVSKGDRLEDVLRAHCGPIDNAYLDVLKSKKFASLTGTISADSTFTSDAVLMLPACIKRAPYVVKTVQLSTPGVVLSDLYKLDPAGLNWTGGSTSGNGREWSTQQSYLSLVEALNPKLDTRTALPVGIDFKLPTSIGAVPPVLPAPLSVTSNVISPGWSELIPLKNGASASAQFLSSVGTLIKSTKPAVTGVAASVEQAPDVRLYSELSDDELIATNSCGRGTRNGNHVNVESTDTASNRTDALAYDISYLREHQQNARRSTIVIPDTGLFRRVNGTRPFIHIDLRARTLGSLDSLEGIRPLTGIANNNHGTYVASVALGRSEMAELAESLGLEIWVLPFNLLAATADASMARVRPEVVNNAVDIADAINGIVNLSIGSTQQLKEIERVLGANQHPLFVAAAGNDGKTLSNLPVYPARYGGSNLGRYNLITVAAADLDGSLAPFSNYGSDYVDIAAPGCDQIVYKFNSASDAYEETKESGTSFAAPQVSLAAALLQSVWPDATPQTIKRRLLSAADHFPMISADAVADSRVLNMSKALSIHQDIVEVTTGNTSRLYRGTIQGREGLLKFCSDQLVLFRQRGADRSIINAIYALDGPTPSYGIYYETSDRIFKKQVCPRPQMSIAMTDDDTNWTYTFPQDSIRSIVFAEPWE